MKKPVTKCQKFFLEVFRSDKHGIRRGVLSQSRGRVLKKISWGPCPQTPSFSHPQVICTACIKVAQEYEQPVYIHSVQKNLVGPKHTDTPPSKFECAPLLAHLACLVYGHKLVVYFIAQCGILLQQCIQWWRHVGGGGGLERTCPAS